MKFSLPTWSVIFFMVAERIFAESDVPSRQLWNEQTDFILQFFNEGLKRSNSSFLAIPDIETKELKAEEVKLGIAWTLQRDSDVFMETPKVDDMKVDGSFSLGEFYLTVNKFSGFGYEGPANFTAKDNGVHLVYYLRHKSKPHHCHMDWETFHLKQFSNFTFHTIPSPENTIDITDYINKVVVTELNERFSTRSFKSSVNSYLDFCIVNWFGKT